VSAEIRVSVEQSAVRERSERAEQREGEGESGGRRTYTGRGRGGREGEKGKEDVAVDAGLEDRTSSRRQKAERRNGTREKIVQRDARGK